MTIRRNRRANSIAAQTTELALAVPQVVAQRVAQMAASSTPMSTRDLKEFQLMGTEKVTAFAESWNAMAWQAMRVNQELMTSFFRSFWSPWTWTMGTSSARTVTQLQNAALGILDKGIEPIRRTATANAKRLARP